MKTSEIGINFLEEESVELINLLYLSRYGGGRGNAWNQEEWGMKEWIPLGTLMGHCCGREEGKWNQVK